MYLLTLDSLSCIYSLYMANTNMSKGLKIYSWGKRIWMANYTSLTLIWCACIFVDSLSKKREREMQIYIMFTSLSNLSYAHRTNTCLFLLKKNHTLKDEIIISAQKRKYKIVKHCKIYLFVLFVTSKSI